MRKATPLLITLAVGIGIGIVADRSFLRLHDFQSVRVETDSFETEINGQKVVVLTDNFHSLHANSK